MPDSPWLVTVHAVRRYNEITGGQLAPAEARARLQAYCAATWARYLDTDRVPRISRTGAYIYRGPGPFRLSLVVTLRRRPDGPRGQLVDVLPVSGWIAPKSETPKKE